jgi:oligopeptide transport system ATP-binding protein
MGTVLSVSELSKVYEVRRSAFSLRKENIVAVDNVSFSLNKGQTLGVVGESGSGKSTLARCILLLEMPDRGEIRFLDKNLTTLGRQELKNLRRDMQIIFQDPYSSLNPRKKVFEAIAEPLLFHHVVSREELDAKVLEIFKNVGLDEDFPGKYPYEMSGGQRQRVAIGRALATNPTLIIADEPVSSLDVSIQAQIVNLFMDIREKLQISMLFVSHDLNIVRFVSDYIIVMYKGRIVEKGFRDEVFLRPLHPYTIMLVTSTRGEFCKTGPEIPADETEGCVYYHRCTRRDSSCLRGRPELFGTEQHSVACIREV